MTYCVKVRPASNVLARWQVFSYAVEFTLGCQVVGNIYMEHDANAEMIQLLLNRRLVSSSFCCENLIMLQSIPYRVHTRRQTRTQYSVSVIDTQVL
jgi:hypothetical protein